MIFFIAMSPFIAFMARMLLIASNGGIRWNPKLSRRIPPYIWCATAASRRLGGTKRETESESLPQPWLQIVSPVLGEPFGFLEGLIRYDAAIAPRDIAWQHARLQKYA